MKKVLIILAILLSLAATAEARVYINGVEIDIPEVINKTATPFNMTFKDMQGQWYTNYGSAVDIAVNLPAGLNGLNACWSIDTAGKYWQVDPNGVEQIDGTSAGGDYLQSDTVAGSFLCLMFRNGKWWRTGQDGAWTEE